MANLAEMQIMALSLMADHGLTDWHFGWDNAKNRAGECRYGARELSFSQPIMALWTMGEARNTVLHEIAHALCPGHGHDATWRAKCVSIGGDGKRCFDGADASAMPEARYTGTCPKGHKTTRDRKTAKMFRISCGKCSPVFNSANMYRWMDSHGNAVKG